MNINFQSGHYRYVYGRWIDVRLNKAGISNVILREKKEGLKSIIQPSVSTIGKETIAEMNKWDRLSRITEEMKSAFVNSFSISNDCIVVTHTYTRVYKLSESIEKMVEDSLNSINISWLKQVKREKGYITEAQLKYLSKLWAFKDIRQVYLSLYGSIPTDNIILGLS